MAPRVVPGLPVLMVLTQELRKARSRRIEVSAEAIDASKRPGCDARPGCPGRAA
jgi:hypothetical protein